MRVGTISKKQDGQRLRHGIQLTSNLLLHLYTHVQVFVCLYAWVCAGTRTHSQILETERSPVSQYRCVDQDLESTTKRGGEEWASLASLKHAATLFYTVLEFRETQSREHGAVSL